MLAVPGAELFSLEVGEGAPLFVLHGGPGASHDYLRPQFDAIASNSGKRLIYYDQRGGGRSPLLPSVKPGTWQDHVADLDLMRSHQNVARADLVGYSWGGLLALLYAVTHPERVGKLALVSPAPATSRDRTIMKERMAAAAKRPEVEALKATLDPHDREARFALAVAGYFWDPRRALELSRFVVKSSAEQAVWSSLGDYDLLPDLAKISVDAFVFHGVDDPIPVASARETAQALGAPILELPRCGHVPYIEAARYLFPSLSNFLAA
jgi:proline iminopeptidase